MCTMPDISINCTAENPKYIGRRRFVCAGLLALLCAGLFLYRANSLPLTDPDESRCALIARNMLRSGDWIVPHLGNHVYFDKPAPFFWLAAGAEKLTGSGELGGRLVAALGGILTVLITYALGCRMFGPAAGLPAGLVLATGGEFLFIARWYRMDMPFEAAMWAAIWWFWRSEDPIRELLFSNGVDMRLHGDTIRRRGGWYGFYIFCAIATLFKGPAGFLLPAMIVGIYLLISGRPRRVFEMFHVPGILVYLAIAGVWFVTISIREPNYAYEFLIRQNLSRFASHTFGSHSFPGILYIPIVMGGMLPWTIYLPTAVIKYFPRKWRLRAQEPAVLFLWTAAIVPLVFFSFSRTKLMSYILPVFAPLAVLIGRVITDWVISNPVRDLSLNRTNKPDVDMKRAAWGLMITIFTCLLAIVGFEIWLNNIDLWSAVAVSLGIIAVLVMYISLRREKRAVFVGCACTAVVMMFLYVIGHTAPVQYEQMSTRRLAGLIDPAEAASAKFCYWNTPKISFEYYTGASEIRQFQHSTPGDIQKLAELLNSDRTAYCLVTGKTEMDELKQVSTDGFRILGQSGHYWLVTNRRK